MIKQLFDVKCMMLSVKLEFQFLPAVLIMLIAENFLWTWKNTYTLQK